MSTHDNSESFFRLSVWFAVALFLIYFWLAIPTWLFGLIDVMEPN